MDAITHTILAIASMASAWYGGRWLQMREARRMWTTIATPEMKREMELIDALIRHMSREDRQYITGISTGVSTEDVSTGVSTGVSTPLQLDLFGAHHEAPSE